MFDELSYVGYTALFCLPPLVLLWLRREFFEVLARRIRAILLSSAVLTLYGSLIWPVALEYGAWSYADDKITNVKLFGYVYLDDVVWWLLVSLLFSSYVALSTHYEQRGVDIVSREIRGLLSSFRNAFRGFRIVPLERNSTIHVAVAVFVLLEGLLFRIGKVEWMFVTAAVAGVVGFELLNGALERLASRQGDAEEPVLGLIKDAAAAGVLVCAIAAAVIGLLIFLNRLLAHLS